MLHVFPPVVELWLLLVRGQVAPPERRVGRDGLQDEGGGRQGGGDRLRGRHGGGRRLRRRFAEGFEELAPKKRTIFQNDAMACTIPWIASDASLIRLKSTLYRNLYGTVHILYQ